MRRSARPWIILMLSRFSAGLDPLLVTRPLLQIRQSRQEVNSLLCRDPIVIRTNKYNSLWRTLSNRIFLGHTYKYVSQSRLKTWIIQILLSFNVNRELLVTRPLVGQKRLEVNPLLFTSIRLVCPRLLS